MRCLFLVPLFIGAIAFAGPKAPADPRIDFHDLPGTNGEWQEGTAIIPAPQEKVRYWLTDYVNWPRRFPDMKWTRVLPDDERGHHVIMFYSHIAGRAFLIHESVAPDLLVFYGSSGSSIHTQGRIYLIDIGGGRTRVHMQSTATVSGFLGLFATRAYRRKSAEQVTTAHLTALLNLAAQH